MKKQETPKEEPKKRFTTVDEILNDSKCKEMVKNKIRSIENSRTDALHKAGSGMKLRRGPYEYLTERSLLNVDSLSSEYLLIVYKRSQLPSAVRDFVYSIMFNAMRDTMVFYRDLDTQAKAKPIRKPRTKTAKKDLV